MSLLKYFFRLQYIDFLIRRKATGNPQVFAQKNHLSKRGLAKVLNEMKEMGFPIRYDKTTQCYRYTKDGKMAGKLFVEDAQILSRDEIKKEEFSNVDNLCFSETSIFEPCGNFEKN
ncbi:MAG: hypothetical protein V4577_09880 [Bacteroidota bacterium]